MEIRINIRRRSVTIREIPQKQKKSSSLNFTYLEKKNRKIRRTEKLREKNVEIMGENSPIRTTRKRLLVELTIGHPDRSEEMLDFVGHAAAGIGRRWLVPLFPCPPTAQNNDGVHRQSGILRGNRYQGIQYCKSYISFVLQ